MMKRLQPELTSVRCVSAGFAVSSMVPAAAAHWPMWWSVLVLAVASAREQVAQPGGQSSHACGSIRTNRGHIGRQGRL